MELLTKDSTRRPGSSQAVVDMLTAFDRGCEAVKGQLGRDVAFAS
jgi:hypothetical protein